MRTSKTYVRTSYEREYDARLKGEEEDDDDQLKKR